MGAAFFACFVFGLSFIFSKMALNIVTPAILLTFRFGLAFILLNLLLLTGKVRFSLKGKSIGWLILLGLLQPVLYFFCENYGIQMTTATFSAAMIALIPIAAMIGGMIFLREIPSVLQAIFLVMSVGGAVFMALLKGSEGTVTILGVILLIGAVIASASYNAVSRKLSGEFSAFERTYLMFVVGLVFFCPMALWETGFDIGLLFSYLQYPEVVGAALFLGAVCSVMAFLCLNYANTHLPVARTTAFSNVTTVVSVFAGVALGESFTVATLIAAVLIIVGVWGVQKFKKDTKEA
ncbi:MAG: DMT family transporter [Firmicutes bacterium]|nr:DMT family transporter [Bacillota bacterium]